jgi:fructokinase
MTEYYGGIESGGTKFKLIVAHDPTGILAEQQFKTTTPGECLQKCAAFFNQTESRFNITLRAVGFGSFGPLDLDPASPTFGFLTGTPKPAWSNTNILGSMTNALHCPVFLETDVNCAALGERVWGAARDLDDFIYVTVGTGIGGGVFLNGKPLHGLIHSELGHMYIPHDTTMDPFPGCCPFHGDCLEGLANGPALQARWGQPAEQLPADHPAWDLEAEYLSLAMANIILIISPRRIILGGGVMQKEGLLEIIRERTRALLKGYVRSEQISKGMSKFLVSPELKERAGLFGAIALARRVI